MLPILAGIGTLTAIKLAVGLLLGGAAVYYWHKLVDKDFHFVEDDPYQTKWKIVLIAVFALAGTAILIGRYLHG